MTALEVVAIIPTCVCDIFECIEFYFFCVSSSLAHPALKLYIFGVRVSQVFGFSISF